MPATFIARRDVAYLLTAATLAQAQHLAAAQTGSQQAMQPDNSSWAGAAVVGLADAALAALPRLLDDPVLLRELMAKWTARLAGLQEAAEAEAKVGVLYLTNVYSVLAVPCYCSTFTGVNINKLLANLC